MNYHNNVDVSVYQGEVKRKSCGTLKLTKVPLALPDLQSTHCSVTLPEVKLSKTLGNIVEY